MHDTGGPLAIKVKGAPKKADGAPVDSLPIAYEVAAVGARIANIHRVAGQRVLEMDHFVESVETPIVQLKLPGAPDVEEKLSLNGKRMMLLQARKVLEQKFLQATAQHGKKMMIGESSGTWAPPLEFRLLSALGEAGGAASKWPTPPRPKIAPYLDPAQSGGGSGIFFREAEAVSAGIPPHAVHYAYIFHGLLTTVVHQILGRKVDDVIGGLYYMPTIRADVFVCSAISDDRPKLHINVQAFEQSMPVECEGDDPSRPTSFTIRTDRWRELLPYWVCRLTHAMNENAKYYEKGGSLGGLYDAKIRKRLHECMGGESADGESLLAAPQKWMPAKVGTALLKPG
mmetsp:Transcript_36730/g.97035  ORF Transcript_36730/g.97035 Transcript_36730/m.97035 type:complete len:342 (-) Transcript_36730:258-1283(-)